MRGFVGQSVRALQDFESQKGCATTARGMEHVPMVKTSRRDDKWFQVLRSSAERCFGVRRSRESEEAFRRGLLREAPRSGPKYKTYLTDSTNAEPVTASLRPTWAYPGFAPPSRSLDSWTRWSSTPGWAGGTGSSLPRTSAPVAYRLLQRCRPGVSE